MIAFPAFQYWNIISSTCTCLHRSKFYHSHWGVTFRKVCSRSQKVISHSSFCRRKVAVLLKADCICSHSVWSSSHQVPKMLFFFSVCLCSLTMFNEVVLAKDDLYAKIGNKHMLEMKNTTIPINFQKAVLHEGNGKIFETCLNNH